MKSVPYTEKLVRGAFGILQPAGGEEIVCGIALTPALAVDRQGVRLGQGGGYYDRYFAAYQNVLRAGLVYEGQIAETLPRDPWDVCLDCAVTELRVLFFSERARGLFA